MKTKEQVISSLKKALEELDITSSLRLSIIQTIEYLQEEPVSGLDNGDMPIERWKQAVEAASNQRNYRSSKGLTETRDDYFVDGVQWADEHPKEKSVSEDLDKVAEEWDESLYRSDAFKAGAKWLSNIVCSEIEKRLEYMQYKPHRIDTYKDLKSLLAYIKSYV